MKPKNDLMTLLFFIIGLVAAIDLVFVQMRQQANEQRATEKLDCLVSVVEAARSNTGYNIQRDNAMRIYVEQGDVVPLQKVLDNPPPKLPDCDISWN